MKNVSDIILSWKRPNSDYFTFEGEDSEDGLLQWLYLKMFNEDEIDAALCVIESFYKSVVLDGISDRCYVKLG